MQTGVQLLAGFLLTLPFQSPSRTSTRAAKPVPRAHGHRSRHDAQRRDAGAVHRHLSGQHVKQRVVGAAQVALLTAVTGVALLVVGMVTLIFDVVVSRPASMTAGGLTAASRSCCSSWCPGLAERD